MHLDLFIAYLTQLNLTYVIQCSYVLNAPKMLFIMATGFQIRVWKQRPSEIQRLKREAFENRITNLGGRKKIMDAILAGKKLISEV